MNVLFVTLADIKSISNYGIYEDLLREFLKNGHNIYVASPTERRNKEKTSLIYEDNCVILKIKTGNIQKANIFEKGIATILLETQFISAIKEYFSDIKFDLVLYSTPPITLAGVIEFVKKRDHAKTYLLLKDIFPQNAVDLDMLSKSGLKGILYKYFRNQEKNLYRLSDKIGCMSPENVKFILNNNPDIVSEKVEVCPNSVQPRDLSLSKEQKMVVRDKFNIPHDKIVFVYGGNLGKPQGISFLIECLKTQINNNQAYFLIVGDGTEYSKLENYILCEKPGNVKLIKRLPKDEYDCLVAACDVGMIFLDFRFSIPNFPSRLLSYMQAKIPVLCVTDTSTDIGSIVNENGFGWWCCSNDIQGFQDTIKIILSDTNFTKFGLNGWNYLNINYNSSNSYKKIIDFMKMS